MISRSSSLASARAAIHLAATTIVDVAAAAAAGSLGATTHAALLASAAGVVAWQPVIRARALQCAAAAIRECVAALPGEISASLECRTAAGAGRIGRGF